MNHCCPLNGLFGQGHNPYCDNHPHKGEEWMTYPDGVGDIRFTYFNGETLTVKRVQFTSISVDVNADKNTLSCEREDGTMFNIPNCAMWEVIYNA